MRPGVLAVLMAPASLVLTFGSMIQGIHGPSAPFVRPGNSDGALLARARGRADRRGPARGRPHRCRPPWCPATVLRPILATERLLASGLARPAADDRFQRRITE